jgi:hypothetical protein
MAEKQTVYQTRATVVLKVSVDAALLLSTEAPVWEVRDAAIEYATAKLRNALAAGLPSAGIVGTPDVTIVSIKE